MKNCFRYYRIEREKDSNWFFNKKGIRDSILQSNANWPFVRMRVRERAQATMHEWFGMNGCWNMCEESILFTTNPWMAKQSNPNRQSMKDFVRPSRHFAPITRLQCTLPLNMKLGMDLYCIYIVGEKSNSGDFWNFLY